MGMGWGRKERMKKKRKKKIDEFRKVTQRKNDILKQEKKFDKEEKKRLKLTEKRNPILRGQWVAQKIRGRSFGNPNLRRKVFACSEKSGPFAEYSDENPITDRKTFNLLRKRNYIVAVTNPTYHCPCCGECKTRMSEWFVQPKVDFQKLPLDLKMNKRPRRLVMCRSCVIAFGWDALDKGKPAMEKIKLYTEIINYYKVNAIDLCRKRKMAGYSVKSFAETVGWTEWYQYRLENGWERKLSPSAMCDLVAALHRVGEEASCDMWGASEERFVIDGPAIQKARTCSQSQFAKKAGWSAAYQNKIENGKVKSVDKRTMDIILQTIY